SLVLIGMLLFSERTWKHHCVTLLVPFSVLAYYLATQPSPRRLSATKCFVVAMLAASALLMAATSTGWSRSLERAGKLAQVYGAYVWANLALVTALAVILRQRSVVSHRRNLKSSRISAMMRTVGLRPAQEIVDNLTCRRPD